MICGDFYNRGNVSKQVNMKKIIVTILILTYAFPSFSISGSVYEQNGNIYYSQGPESVQLTSSGIDRAPVLSPDNKTIAFIRKSKKKAYITVGGEEDYAPEDLLADQVWVVGIGGKNEKILVRDRNPDEQRDREWKGEDVIAHIDDNSLRFSPEGEKLYFISSAWMVSGAVHCTNVDGTGERFVTDGNSLEIVPKGKYKGHLIVQKHKYYLAGGSYDWLWLDKESARHISRYAYCYVE